MLILIIFFFLSTHRLRPLIGLAGMNGSNVSPSLSTGNFSTPYNAAELFSKVYVLRPITPSTKLAMLLPLVPIGIIALGGNVLILLFLKTKFAAKSILRACSFQMNFNLYIKSLAISDILSNIISLPYVGLQLYLDVLQRGWGCKIGRYLALLFPCITINNLLAISFGKYFSTRQIPRTFSHYTVKRIVLFAWLAGFFLPLFPAATFDGIRYDLNNTHYTVSCMYDTQYLPFRITLVSFTFLQYIVPSFILIKLNISLIITLCTRTRRIVDVQRDNGIRSMARTARIRSIYTVVVLTFAFVTPYLFYVAYVIYHMVARPKVNFETDMVIRNVGVIIALSNSAINVAIYFLRMKDFRNFLKNKLKILSFKPEYPIRAR